ncbi:transcription factor FER-LIKE IRON DEFICIENCY-INDUCED TRANSCRIPTION FACTOR [Magnolia sinica]|uniref:transcription factor FER-LIKE IRON DEFICIENCY-INDUCED TRANSCRIPTION FACTOR n=1 Tax=Magnolia sinica TaxID=86752 RepID=UPI002659A13C|nr:transcription factor FER-LIKE IRON DEFICIENCY-INDUCED TRANSCRIPTION FACTOR [Magnolia sinica]
MENHAHINPCFNDFTDDNSFAQMIDVLRGENVIADPIASYYHHPNNSQGEFNWEIGFMDDVHGYCPTPEDMFDFNTASISDPDSFVQALQPPFAGEIEENMGDDSSASMMIRTTMHSADRSRTLISERRRRGRMKEKLYALRSLVPNITKMDKASIVGDAVVYVQDLQKQVKQLRAEITGLESSSIEGGCERLQGSLEQTQAADNSNNNKILICRKVVKMDVFQVEERGFYVRLVCNKGDGVAVALYKALESLTCFHVQSSNFSTLPGRFILTFTLNVRECGEETSVSALKLWVMGALLHQGFDFKATSP